MSSPVGASAARRKSVSPLNGFGPGSPLTSRTGIAGATSIGMLGLVVARQGVDAVEPDGQQVRTGGRERGPEAKGARPPAAIGPTTWAEPPTGRPSISSSAVRESRARPGVLHGRGDGEGQARRDRRAGDGQRADRTVGHRPTIRAAPKAIDQIVGGNGSRRWRSRTSAHRPTRPAARPRGWPSVRTITVRAGLLVRSEDAERLHQRGGMSLDPAWRLDPGRGPHRPGPGRSWAGRPDDGRAGRRPGRRSSRPGASGGRIARAQSWPGRAGSCRLEAAIHAGRAVDDEHDVARRGIARQSRQSRWFGRCPGRPERPCQCQGHQGQQAIRASIRSSSARRILRRRPAADARGTAWRPSRSPCRAAG